jgi:hypothetical protein
MGNIKSIGAIFKYPRIYEPVVYAGNNSATHRQGYWCRTPARWPSCSRHWHGTERTTPVAALVNVGVRMPALREALSIINGDGDSDSLQTASCASALCADKFCSFSCCFHMLKPPCLGHVRWYANTCLVLCFSCLKKGTIEMWFSCDVSCCWLSWMIS